VNKKIEAVSLKELNCHRSQYIGIWKNKKLMIAVVKMHQTINDVNVSGGREILKEAVIDENKNEYIFI
jgi:hypothetical protein